MYRAFLPGLWLWREDRGLPVFEPRGARASATGPERPPVRLLPRRRARAGRRRAAALGSFLSPTIGRLLLPVVALALLLITGEVNGTILVAVGISLVLPAVSA